MVKDEYLELLRFQTVGADPTHLRDCVSCASWLKKWLGKLGFEGELLYPPEVGTGPVSSGTVPPPPVLFAERKGTEGAPTVLLYGHYDVQPADPLDEWMTPPFEPTERDGRVYARGAQDDKGQFFAFLCGIRDFLESVKMGTGPNSLGTGPNSSGTDPNSSGTVPTLKVLLEGQEESGSAALAALAPTIRRRLAADVLAVCDTSAAADLRPAIVAGLRGVSHFMLRLTAGNRDLHSGEYGGVAPNPAQGMATLLASLHTPDGAIAVAGFRDGIEPPTADELRLAAAGLGDESAYAADIGCDPAGGQLGKTIAERISFEPTIEINGIHTGYGGPGSKTVIPREAMAKLSMRLVPGQNPKRALAAVRSHLEDRVPKGMKLSIEEVSGEAPGFRLPVASPLFRLAESVLREMDGRGPVFQWDGASIPIVSALREASGAAPLMVGWGQPEDRIHSPNESFSSVQFEKARDWSRRFLAAFVGF